MTDLLTRLLEHFDLLLPPWIPDPRAPSFPRKAQQVEWGLTYAWIIISAGLMILLLPAALIGQRLDGTKGYTNGIYAGIVFVLFAYAGAVIHFLRYILIRVYTGVMGGGWSARSNLRIESLTALRLMTPTDVDLLFQALLTLLASIILFGVRPIG